MFPNRSNDTLAHSKCALGNAPQLEANESWGEPVLLPNSVTLAWPTVGALSQLELELGFMAWGISRQQPPPAGNLQCPRCPCTAHTHIAQSPSVGAFCAARPYACLWLPALKAECIDLVNDLPAIDQCGPVPAWLISSPDIVAASCLACYQASAVRCICTALYVPACPVRRLLSRACIACRSSQILFEKLRGLPLGYVRVLTLRVCVVIHGTARKGRKNLLSSLIVIHAGVMLPQRADNDSQSDGFEYPTLASSATENVTFHGYLCPP